jgi:hypothetical protein
MHSAWIASIPPHDSADVNIAGTSLGLDDRAEREFSSPLSGGKEMQHAVDDHRFFAAKIPFRLVDSRIFCASRMRVRYPDFGHNYGFIGSGLAGVF